MLIPVWGERYVRRFATLSLASLLAPGNLPALAAETDLEFVILTAAKDALLIECDAAFQKLREIVTIRFITIDDLIIDQLSGVILTLAYFRGITDAGDDMVNRHFLFLNSDIILADGSLRSVAKHIREGRRIVLANSVRAVSEDLEAPLRQMVQAQGGVLAVPPRKLVGMALDALHPLQIAKIVNNDLCHSQHVNQFYWQVDRHTLIIRHFLMFMLCLKPERVVHEIHAFCDYAFVAEFCPSGGAVAMEDSDDFFALEMQQRDSESSYLRLGAPSLREVADSLSIWTTQLHRDDSLNHTLIFHAQDLPPETQAMCSKADRYIRELHGLLTPEPKPFRRHLYWVGAYYAYETRKALLRCEPPPPLPPEFRSNGAWRPSRAQRMLAQARGLTQRVYWRLFGVPPFVSILHPDWLAYRAVLPTLESHRGRPDSAILHVRDATGELGGAVGPVQACEIAQVLESEFATGSIGDKSLTLALVELTHADLELVRPLADRLDPKVQTGGQIIFFVKESRLRGNGISLAERLRHAIAFVAPRDLHRAHFIFCGGTRQREIRRAFDWLTGLYRRRGVKLAPIILPALAMLVLAAAHNNRRQSRATPPRPEDCSSFMLTIDV